MQLSLAKLTTATGVFFLERSNSFQITDVNERNEDPLEEKYYSEEVPPPVLTGVNIPRF